MNARDLVAAVDLIDEAVDVAVELDVDVAAIATSLPFGNLGPDVTLVVRDESHAARLARRLRLPASPAPAGVLTFQGTASSMGRLIVTTTWHGGA